MDENETRVRTEISAPGVLTITFDGPARRNAISGRTGDELLAAVRRAHADVEIRAVVLCGVGGFFSAGGDLKAPPPGPEAGKGVGARGHRLSIFQESLDVLHRTGKPVLAAVEGGAIGVGWSFVLACDLVVAAEDAYFCAPFTERGLVPDGGAAWFLVRALGRRRAAELMLLADRIAAPQAQELGLVNRVVPPGKALTETLALAERLATGAPDALAFTKRLLTAAEHTPNLRDFLDHEWATAALTLLGPDVVEGRAAFAEKRPPDFTNHR